MGISPVEGASKAMALITGRRGGPYELEALIGKGGLGEVYRARDTQLNRRVALKFLAPGPPGNEETLARFGREARTGALLNHPNIVAVYDVGTHDGAPFVVSELLEGQTLRSALSAGALPADLAVHYARQMTEGLVAAHEIGVVHRDLKPENIFITALSVVKILDFGLAGRRQQALEELEDTSVATWPHNLLGTVGYMSPEQIRGLALDERSDLFSVGVMLFEMVSGVPPFWARSPVETLSAILQQEPPMLRRYCDAAPDLERIIRHCLVKDREYRFQCARDLLVNLELIAPAGLQAGRNRDFEVSPIRPGLVTSLLKFM